MTVRQVFVAGRALTLSGAGYEPVGAFLDGEQQISPAPPTLELLRAGVLSSDAKLRRENERWQIEGDPTEAALGGLPLRGWSGMNGLESLYDGADFSS